MFGIFYAIFAGFKMMKESIDDESFTQEQKLKAIKKEKDTYYDAKGYLHYINGNKDIKCLRTVDTSNMHEVLYDSKNHCVIKDYTQESLEQMENDFKQNFDYAKQKAIEEHKSYFQVKHIVFPSNYPNYSGKTDKRTIVRYIVENEKPYYLEDRVINSNNDIYDKELKQYRYCIWYCDVDKFSIKTNGHDYITEGKYRELGGWMPKVR